MSIHQPSSSMSSNEVVQWASGLGAITAESLARRNGTSLASARGVLARAVREGLMGRSRVLADQPTLYHVTRSGLRHVGGPALAVCRVRASNARHLIACADVAATLERRHPDHRVQGERALRWEERAERRPLASPTLGMAGAEIAALHRPDLVLWPSRPADGRPVAIEVELTIKSPRRLAQICRAWARCRLVAGVLYLAPPDVARALARAVAQAQGGDQIVVLELASMLEGSAADLDRTIAVDV
jgi:hypothetical protein